MLVDELTLDWRWLKSAEAFTGGQFKGIQKAGESGWMTVKWDLLLDYLMNLALLHVHSKTGWEQTGIQLHKETEKLYNTLNNISLFSHS